MKSPWVIHKGDLLILQHVLEKQESIAFSRDGHACGCYFTCKSHSTSTLVELLACPRICPRTHPTQPSQPGMHPSKVALDVPYLEGSPDKGQCSLHSNYCPRNGGVSLTQHHTGSRCSGSSVSCAGGQACTPGCLQQLWLSHDRWAHTSHKRNTPWNT